MSTSNTSNTLAQLTGGYTNHELNIAGAGGFKDDDDVLLIEIALHDLPTLDIVGSIDPYIRISRKKEDGDGWVQMYISDPIYRNKNPVFPPFALHKTKLASSTTSQFLVEVLDKDVGSPSDDYVGLVMVSLGSFATFPTRLALVKTHGTSYEGNPIIEFVSIKEVKGKDAPGGATLTADGQPSASAKEASAKAAAAAKVNEQETVAAVDKVVDTMQINYEGGLLVNIPTAPVKAKGGAFSFAKWLGLEDNNVWRG